MAAGYYVDLVRAGRIALLAGPFRTHGEALGIQARAVSLAGDLDPWSHFDAHGTCRLEPATKIGILNGRLGLPTTMEGLGWQKNITH